MNEMPFSYSQGYSSCLANASSLLQIASLAAADGKFGIGCSLNILAAEEAIKALVCVVKELVPEEAEDFEKIFKDHKFKHKGIKEFLDGINENKHLSLSSVQLAFLEWKVKAYEYMKTHPGMTEKEFKSKFFFLSLDTIEKEAKRAETLIYLNKWLKELREVESDIDAILDWVSDANEEKNRGLYVALVDNVWLTPESFSNKTFEMEHGYVITVIEYVRKFLPILTTYARESKTGLFEI